MALPISEQDTTINVTDLKSIINAMKPKTKITITLVSSLENLKELIEELEIECQQKEVEITFHIIT